MKAMGGATCTGGLVSMDEDAQLQDSPLVTYLPPLNSLGDIGDICFGLGGTNPTKRISDVQPQQWSE